MASGEAIGGNSEHSILDNTMPGYSETPLPKKLGIKSPLTLVSIDAPQEYLSWLGELPVGVHIISKLNKPLQAVHLFVVKRATLEKNLVTLRKKLEQTGFVWVSWPKKASKVETDISEDVIREVALPLGFVDIKVCAVSDIWSGLKLVIRKVKGLFDKAIRWPSARMGQTH